MQATSLQRIIQWSGIASLFFYVAATFAVNRGYSIFAITALIGGAYGLYVFLWHAIRRTQWDDYSWKWALGFGMALISVGACIVPPAKTDVYHYIVEDRIWVLQQENPFLISPAVVADEDPLVQLSHWQQLAVQHGPARLFLTAPGTLLSHGLLPATLLWYRCILITSIALAAWAVYRLARQVSSDWAMTATVLLVWNPLIVFEVFYNGGTDIIMMALFLASLVFLANQKVFIATTFFIASVLVKYITILALPLFLLQVFFTAPTKRQGIGRVIGSLVIMLPITLLAFAPFWQGPAIFDSLLWVASVIESNSLAGMVAALVVAAGGGLHTGMFATFGLALFLVGCLGVLTHALSTQGRIRLAGTALARYHTYVFGLFITFGKTWLYPKYMLWVVPLLLTEPALAPAAIVLSGLAITAMFDPGFILLGLVPGLVVWVVARFLVDHLHTA